MGGRWCKACAELGEETSCNGMARAPARPAPISPASAPTARPFVPGPQ